MKRMAGLALMSVLLGSATAIGTLPAAGQAHQDATWKDHGGKPGQSSSTDSGQHGNQTGNHSKGQGSNWTGGKPQDNKHDRDNRSNAGSSWTGGASDRDRHRDRDVRDRDHRGDNQFGGGTFDRRPDNWNRRPTHFNRLDYNRNVFSHRRFHWKPYVRPHGWYSHRWVFGERLPFFFWTHDYWLTDWWMFGLPIPPFGCEWVRVGDDAILIDTRTGEILQVVYGVFW